MTRYKSNLLANFAGTGMAALLQLAFIPLYIRFLGIEAYGLIGFYVMLQSILQVLDLGMGPTMNREMARYSVQPGKAEEARDFARTLEAGYWVLGASAGAFIALAAPVISTRWVNAGTLPVPMVRNTLLLMGCLTAIQMPLTFYQGGLMGLQRQVLYNGVKIAASVLASGGAVLVLWLVSPTVTTFFGWQLIIAALQIAVLGWALWRNLPAPGYTPRFTPSLLRNVWRFTAGMSGITVSAIILTQTDKILLSRLLTLEMFGYYTLATAVGNGLYVLITPVFNATFPRLTAMVASGDEKGVRDLYHLGTQVMAVLVLPVALVISFFSREIMMLWTGSAETARHTAPIVSILIAGTAMNGLMNLPYALQLAHGWTRIGLTINIGLILSFVPAIFFLVPRFGAIGGAVAWTLMGSSYIIVGIPATHARILQGDGWKWFSCDVAPPLAAALIVIVIYRFSNTFSGSQGPLLPALLALWITSAGMAALSAKWTRDWIFTQGRLLLSFK